MPHKDKTKRRAYFTSYKRRWRLSHPHVQDTSPAGRAKVAAAMRRWKAGEDPAHKAERLARKNARQLIRYREDEVFRAKQIAAQKVLNKRIRAALLAGYGGKCVCCGESESMFLELDHVNGGGNREHKAMKSAVNLYRRVIADGFPDTYRLLCANCNRGRYRNGGHCPHNRGI